MSKEKYLANIDRVLKDVVSRNSSDLKSKNKILYSEDLEKSGAIKKIAFDVYRVENDPYSNLWTLEDLNGKPYLIRASDPQYENYNNGDWTVISNVEKNNITLAYKRVPITSFSSESYGFNSEDIMFFKDAVLDNLNKDEDFLKNILLEQPEQKRLALVGTFPEFKKFLRG